MTPHNYDVEPYFTIKQAATELGLKYFQLLRLVKSRKVASYDVNGRQHVKLSEIVAVIDSTRVGGSNESL